MKPIKSHLPLIFGSAVLLTAVAIIGFRKVAAEPTLWHGPVKSLLPTAAQLKVDGWAVNYLPVADTPEMKAAVTEMLHYNDAVYAVYTKGTAHVAVYLAHWRPGQQPPRLIEQHTPDVCWVSSGWKCSARDEIPSLRMSDGKSVVATRYRTFVMGGTTEYVAYWHTLDGKVLAGDERPSPRRTIAGLLRGGLSQHGEQFFLRISSNRPLRTIWPTRLVQAIVEALPLTQPTTP